MQSFWTTGYERGKLFIYRVGQRCHDLKVTMKQLVIEKLVYLIFTIKPAKEDIKRSFLL